MSVCLPQSKLLETTFVGDFKLSIVIAEHHASNDNILKKSKLTDFVIKKTQLERHSYVKKPMDFY